MRDKKSTDVKPYDKWVICLSLFLFGLYLVLKHYIIGSFMNDSTVVGTALMLISVWFVGGVENVK